MAESGDGVLFFAENIMVTYTYLKLNFVSNSIMIEFRRVHPGKIIFTSDYGIAE